MPTDIDIAWAAGLFEGEGCFSALNPGARDRLKRRGVIAAMTTSDLDVLERFQAIVGVGTIISIKTDNRWPSHKPLWKWQCQRRSDVESVGEMFRSYLGERRLTRLNEILAIRWDHKPMDCAYCGDRFVPSRARKQPAYCSKVCSTRAWAGVKNPRVKEQTNG